MSDLNERIKEIIETIGMKKTAFAERLNVSQAFVSQLCSGVSQPSNRTISDICREFDVSEEWLRTGRGEMFVEKTESEELAAFFGDLLKDEPDFRHRLISALSRLTLDEWKVLEKLAKETVEGIKKKAPIKEPSLLDDVQNKPVNT